jgi:Kef-type K+ transport system membrane component KefB/CBS domain-containing protein
VPLAVALLLSLAVGRFASGYGIPRVTVYLLVGLFLGPHIGLAWAEPGGILAQFMLGPDTEVPLRVLQELGVGFILFSIGAAFRFPIFREVGPRVLGISASEVGLTSLLVGAAVYLATGDWRLGVIAPALAVASAPSATLVTLREVEAEGPTTRCLMLCVGHNNLIALITYPVLASLAFGVGGAGGATLSALVALVGGGVIGFAAAVWLESITGRRELVLLGILVVLATLGIAHWGEIGGTGLGMLACFAAGLAIANGSPHSDELFRYLENTVYPIYVLFFIAAGRDLHLDAIAQGGLLAVFFIAARSAGKLYGARIGMRLTGLRDSLPKSLGAGLLCQAGIALGLVASLEQVAPAETAHLRHVVVASVVIFELIGPFLVRHVVVRAGEVTLANLLPNAEAKGAEALRWVYLEFRRNLGLLKDDSDSENKTTVEHAMRRRPRFVPETLSFERVLKALGETGADLLPVLDHDAHFKGVISYEEVKNTLYDPFLRGLVIAEDLTSNVEDALDPDESLARALEVLDRHRVQSWPVVKDRKLLGIVRRTDIYAMMRRR